jgi:O-antigen/teichoic acid export membrane protein
MNKQIRKKGGLVFFSAGLVFANFMTTLVIARSLGFGVELDMYYLTLSVYLFLLSAIGWSLTNVITPILIKEGVDKVLAKVFYTILLWALLIYIFLVLLTPFVVSVIYNNYLERYSLNSIYLLFRLSCSIFVIDLLAQILIFYENASERFLRAISINFLSSLVGLSSSYYIVGLYGVNGALGVQLLIKMFLLSVLFLLNRKYLSPFIYDRRIAGELFSRAKYFFVSGLYYRTEDLVEKYIASFLAPGYLSLVSFVQRIYGAIITVFNTAVITPTLTRFCKSDTSEEKISDYKVIRLIVILIMILGIVSSPIMYFFGDEFLLLMFSDKLATVQEYVTLVLVVLFPTLILLTVNQLLHNFLLSRSKEKSIAMFDMIAYSISLVTKFAATYSYGFLGFLLSITLSSSIKLFFKSYITFKVIKLEKENI